MYHERLEQLIDAALADGELTEKEKQILFKKAQEMGVDLDEFEMVLDGRLVKLKKAEEEKAKSSAPKSNKLGDVKKCPNCGAIVQSYQGVCSECGFAFEGLDANSAVKELSNLLQKTSNQNQMEKVIDTYPVPMEKASLLAFVTWLRPQSTDGKNPLANSYFKKYSECVNKIRVSFANDKDLLPFLSYYESDVKKIRNHKIVKFTLKNKWFWIGVGIFIILFFILKPTPVRKSAEKSNVAIEKALKDNDTQKAITIFLNFEGKGKYKGKYQLAKLGAAVAIINACLAEDDLRGAISIGKATGMDFNGFYDYEKQPALLIYDYCISHGDFETAKSIYQGTNCNFYFHGKYIKDVCTNLCENGKINEAQRFLNNHKGEIHNRYDNLGEPKEVIKMIQDIINSYK